MVTIKLEEDPELRLVAKETEYTRDLGKVKYKKKMIDNHCLV